MADSGKIRIALLQPFPAPVSARIREICQAPSVHLDIVADTTPETRRAALRDADYAVVVSQNLTAGDLAFAGKLRLVHKWGSGTDGVDLAALRERNLPLLSTTGTNARYVAELALTLMLSVLRGIPQSDRAMRKGRWTGSAHWTSSRTLHGRTVGIVGFGAVGSALAALLRPFGCDMSYAARTRRAETVEKSLGVRPMALGDILRSCEIVSLHVPLTSETKGMIGRAELALMRSDAILVNLARGDVVDEGALAEALLAGRLAGAGLDVFQREPEPGGRAFADIPNTVLTPHIGGKVRENLDATVRHWFSNILAHAQGQALPDNERI